MGLPAKNPDYQIVAAHNNVPNLRIFEEIAVANGRPEYFVEPRAYPNYNYGDFKLRGNGLVVASGYAAVTWILAVVSREQVYYLRTTYCANGYSGLVTVRTTTGRAGTFANYNAVLILPKEVDANYRIKQFVDFPMVLTRLVAI